MKIDKRKIFFDNNYEFISRYECGIRKKKKGGNKALLFKDLFEDEKENQNGGNMIYFEEIFESKNGGNMIRKIVARQKNKFGANTHFLLNDGSILTIELAVEMCKKNLLPGYEIDPRNEVEYLRAKRNNKKVDNINKQPLFTYEINKHLFKNLIRNALRSKAF